MHKTMSFLAVIGAVLFMSAAIANAHGTPCCEAKPCPDGRTAVPGDSPEEAQCCFMPEDPEEEPSDCIDVANAGWRCMIFQDDPAGMVAAIPDRQGTAGCVDGEFGTCVGGTIDTDGPAGCIGVGGVHYVTSSSPEGGTIAECTEDAVDACCAKDACEVAPDEDEDDGLHP